MDDVRIGVFICHCGTNIGGFLDVKKLVEYASTLPNVVFSMDNLYTCSEIGLNEIKKAIVENKLNRVVVASCTPRTHEALFREVCREAGLNPYLFEFVNIREQCSWVHMRETETATEKAKDLIRMGVARAVLLTPQEEIKVDVTPCALVIGGGIAGMTCALTLAKRGFEVKLVEKEDRLGGMLNSLYRLYPNNELAANFIQKMMKGIEENDKITVFTSSTVKSVEGFVGNYDIVIEREGSEISVKVGVIIVAIGARVLKPVGMYGYNGRDVIAHLELEETLKEGRLDAEKIVMIQCVGSRDEKRIYCSKICCMNSLKNAMLIKEMKPEAEIYILYRDMQTHGTKYEKYYEKAREMGILFVKYAPEKPPIVEDGTVKVFDVFLGEELTMPYDLVVLSTPLIAHPEAEELAKMLKVPLDENGFFLEAHVKLRPVDFATDGIFLCGCAHWPCDISESISQAYAAASRASILLSRGEVTAEPIIAVVDEEKCIGCGLCELLCPFKAIRIQETEKGRVAEVIAASCKGCGVCGAGCPEKAITMRHFTDEQLLAQLRALAGVVT